MKKRELIIIPSVIALLGIVVYFVGKLVDGSFFLIFFPQCDRVYEMIKLYFTSFLILYIAEVFIKTEAKNQLLSHVLSSMAMMVITLFLCTVLFKVTTLLSLIIIYLLSIWGGQYLSFIIQGYNIKYSNILAIVLQTLLTVAIAYLAYYMLCRCGLECMHGANCQCGILCPCHFK